MRVRTKIIATLIGTVVPISVAFTAFRIGAEHRAVVERRADRVASRLMERPPRGCPRDPAHWQMERRAVVAFAYGPDFRSENPHAPPFPPKLAREVQEVDDEPAHHWFWPGAPFLGATAVRTPHEGPCAYVLLGWRREGPPPPTLRRAVEQTAILSILLLGVAGFIAMPITGRLRRLKDAVRDARTGKLELDLGGDDEFSELGAAFAETLGELTERDEALKQYIANTTHDLAIPLTVLQHRLRTVRKKISDGVPLDPADLDVALEESHYIGGLIANMSAAAKLESPDAIALDHEVALHEIVPRVVARHEPIAAQRGVELNWAVPDEPIVVRGEPTLVEQALSNFVQNAVQYNAAGGHVALVLEAVGDGFEVRVIDDGPGIPAELRAEVLRRGVRADEARTRNEQGQGFGLSIARKVCELHGWELELGVPPEGEGLQVSVTYDPSPPK